MSTGPAIAEFEVIDRYFQALGAPRDDVPLGVGDDAALLAPPPGRGLCIAATSCGAQRSGETMQPEALARDAVSAAVSTLQAAAAQPAWATLALSLERVDCDWLERFAAVLDQSLRSHGVALVGGDTTRGPTTVTLHLLGLSDAGPGACAPSP